MNKQEAIDYVNAASNPKERFRRKQETFGLRYGTFTGRFSVDKENISNTPKETTKED